MVWYYLLFILALCFCFLARDNYASARVFHLFSFLVVEKRKKRVFFVAILALVVLCFCGVWFNISILVTLKLRYIQIYTTFNFIQKR